MTKSERTRLKSIRMWLGLRPVSGVPCLIGAIFFVSLIPMGDSMLVGSPSPLRKFIGGCLMALGLVGFVVVGFVGSAKTRSNQKHPAGHCQTCGYNLTGNVSGICPECGKPCEPDAGVT